MLFEDLFSDGGLIIDEAATAKKRSGVLSVVEGPFGVTETQNKNERIYKNSLWEKVLKLKAGDLKDRAIVGEPEHPNSLHARIERISHVVTDLKLKPESNTLWGRAEILDTPTGRILDTLFKANVKVGISSRGAGSIKIEKGKNYVNEDDYVFAGFDFVSNPSAPNAYPKLAESLLESLEPVKDKIQEDREYYDGLLGRFGVSTKMLLEGGTPDAPETDLLVEDRICSSCAKKDEEIALLRTDKVSLIKRIKEAVLRLPEEDDTPPPDFDDVPDFDTADDLQRQNEDLCLLLSSYKRKLNEQGSELQELRNKTAVLGSQLGTEQRVLEARFEVMREKDRSSMKEAHALEISQKDKDIVSRDLKIESLKSKISSSESMLESTSTQLETSTASLTSVTTKISDHRRELVEAASELFDIDRVSLEQVLSEDFTPRRVLEGVMSLSPKLSDPTLPLARVPGSGSVVIETVPGVDPSDGRPRPGPRLKGMLSSPV